VRRLFSRRQLLRALAAYPAARWLLNAQVSSQAPAGKLSMPGLYPGRVAGVYNPATLADGRVQREAVRNSVRKGMADLTDTDGGAKAWKKFFDPGDIVGIKVNPNSPHVHSSPEVLHEIIAGLNSAGVPNANIVVYDRYRKSFADAGMASWIPEGVRTAFAADQYTDDQTGIDGYDPDHYVELPLVAPPRDPKDPVARRSYAARFITRQVNKLINLAVLKDHDSSGVTLCLKNLSHGLVNNVNRSHPTSTANACGVFIPAVVSMPVIRNKTVLHVVDGIRGLYHTGPVGKAEFVWEPYMMYFGTDPVAVDHIGMIVIDQQRESVGLARVSEAFAGKSATMFRQPEHIELSGIMGLGVFAEKNIDFRGARLKA
jgi:uncharacterized protein (DUF362 family)